MVETPSGAGVPLRAYSRDIVRHVKPLLDLQYDIPTTHVLVFRGVQLVDESTMSDYNTQDGSMLHVV